MFSKLIVKLLGSRVARRLARQLTMEDRVNLLSEAWRLVNTGLDYKQRFALMAKTYDMRRIGNFPLQTSSTYSRIHGFFRLVEGVANVRGDVVECGVGRGGSLTMLAYAVSAHRLTKTVYGFDSFSGFPPASVQDLGSRVTESGKIPEGWTDTSPELITSAFELDRAKSDSLLRRHDVRVKIVPGFFEDTLEVNLPEEIALLHVDCDLYDSTRVVLERCLPRMSPGGIVVFDEYHDQRWPGAKRAVDEICSNRGFEVTYFDAADRFILRLPTSRNLETGEPSCTVATQ